MMAESVSGAAELRCPIDVSQWSDAYFAYAEPLLPGRLSIAADTHRDSRLRSGKRHRLLQPQRSGEHV